MSDLKEKCNFTHLNDKTLNNALKMKVYKHLGLRLKIIFQIIIRITD
jgi:hypothetical protein